jgi:hypothetical protein
MVQPLSGVLVIDFTTLLPGPLATLMLAEAGAEVIKIERPGEGDPQRKLGQAHSIPQHPFNFCWHLGRTTSRRWPTARSYRAWCPRCRAPFPRRSGFPSRR